ncbi:MAG TPA: RibD family protein [Leptolyngbyaceae cyanobacterium M33_DOE_097]|uniref:RibD family protein n=1 Tax=Oscillatoriales cyanobacterium SpSt-418 TaxID=2282169 RepID=A0A7C3PDV4_9CYAN|nr:RibD family protein [Leptolyngbyaceae cyanobacterium M33_DOE_097]
MTLQRPHLTAILATSLDGKIADRRGTAARFGSVNDKAHLEQQVAQVDAVLIGAGTLRAYGSSVRITSQALLTERQQFGKPAQPIHIVCSASGNLEPDWLFFRQPISRWLLTTREGGDRWQGTPFFEQLLASELEQGQFQWPLILHQLWSQGIERLAVLGGGTLVGSLLSAHLLDEIWLTLCPFVFGSQTAPTLVEGVSYLEATAPRFRLLEVRANWDEVFLHYQIAQTNSNLDL